MLTLIDGALERFLADDDGKPVVMLNLLRFRPDGGRERYELYRSIVEPIAERYGVEVIYGGFGLSPLAAQEGQAWDAIAIVRYPGRGAVVEMAMDRDYVETAAPLRKAALSEVVLQPMSD